MKLKQFLNPKARSVCKTSKIKQKNNENKAITRIATTAFWFERISSGGPKFKKFLCANKIIKIDKYFNF